MDAPVKLKVLVWPLAFSGYLYTGIYPRGGNGDGVGWGDGMGLFDGDGEGAGDEAYVWEEGADPDYGFGMGNAGETNGDGGKPWLI